jgi:hypothetical protein
MTLPTLTQAHPPLPLADLVREIKKFSTMAGSEKRALISRLVKVHPTLSLHWGPGHQFRRARKFTSGVTPQHVDEIIWRKDAPATLGRANPKGFSVMYVADRQDTALREARIDADWATISEFQIRPGNSIFICPIGEFLQIVRTGRGFLSGDASDGISAMLNACPHEEAQSLLLTDAFLFEQFVGHDDHELSSFVAMEIFSKSTDISAIAYSSTRQLGAINLAIKADSFWDSWGLTSMRHGYAEHLALGFYNLSNIKRSNGIYHSGKISWEHTSNDELSTLLLDPPYFPDS